MLEYRLAQEELDKIEGSLHYKEYTVKQMLKEKGFNLTGRITCTEDFETGDIIYRQLIFSN